MPNRVGTFQSGNDRLYVLNHNSDGSVSITITDDNDPSYVGLGKHFTFTGIEQILKFNKNLIEAWVCYNRKG